MTRWRRPCKSNSTVQPSTGVLLTSRSADKDLLELSQLGHFLKGSSATLGLTKVKDACEKIQHFGARKDETGTTDEPDDAVSLKHIKNTLAQAKKDYTEVEAFLRKLYEDSPASD